MSSSPRRGILVIISSPSGAGKTTLARRLLAEFSRVMEFSVSYTTRPARKGEQHGVDYCFVSNGEFDRMVERDEFAEHATVHGNRYGTSRVAVERALVGGRDVVFDVDGQGGRALKSQFADDALMVFILPPSLDVLQSRLRGRATDAPDVIERRLKKAIEEFEYHRDYTHRVVNDDLDTAYALLRAIYLLRKGDESIGLDACRALVERNDEVANKLHAEKLIKAGTR